jgi:hypothetical protein
MANKPVNLFAPKLYQLLEKKDGSTQPTVRVGEKDYVKNQLGYATTHSA